MLVWEAAKIYRIRGDISTCARKWSPKQIVEAIGNPDDSQEKSLNFLAKYKFE